MKHYTVILGSIILLFFVTSCSTTDYETKTISISGAIELPLVTKGERYWIDDGPLFIASRNPLVTYRAIKKQELEFAGTEKPVYEFFESSFSNPEDIVEQSFRNYHSSYELNEKSTSSLNIYSLSKHDDSKAYIASPFLNFGVEVYVKGNTSRIILQKIIDDVNLTNRDISWSH